MVHYSDGQGEQSRLDAFLKLEILALAWISDVPNLWGFLVPSGAPDIAIYRIMKKGSTCV